jgi:hypothetical protein
VTGRVATLRRRWIRRLGWYPGDWIWISLLTLVVGLAGAATAIVLTNSDASATSPTFIATSPVTVTQPAPVPTATSSVNTSTLPTAPEPTTATSKTGEFAWPADENGWTIVLVSYPKTNGEDAARRSATKAAKASLSQVGVLDSSSYASLQPGYLVVFTGVYGSKADADAAVATARQAGFGGAYSRQIAR